MLIHHRRLFNLSFAFKIRFQVKIRPITSSAYSIVNNVLWNGFQVIGPSEPGKEIDNSSSNIQTVVA